MNTILVTGGAGFIGSAFVRQWIAEETATVVNLDKLTYAGNLDSLGEALYHPRHVFRQGDICDRVLVMRLLNEFQPEAVVNLAAETHVDRSIDAPAPFFQTNVIGTFELLEAVRGFYEGLPIGRQASFRLLHVSTDEVYGSLEDEGYFTEESAHRPNSPYGASKAASDDFVRAYHRTYGLPTLVTHSSNNYGPCQFPEKLVPLMILNALESKPLPVYGDGQNVRDWLHVDDHCRALRQVLTRGKPGEVYNIGGNCERTNLQLVQTICEIVDRLRMTPGHSPSSKLITFVPDRPGHDRRYALDTTKAQRELGWSPAQELQSGLEMTVRWYMDNSRWLERVTSGKYQRERLGLPRGEKAE